MTEQHEHNDQQPGKKPRRQRKRAHGEGSVFELKGRNRKKPWVAQITLENGRKKQTYHGTQQEAIAARRKMLNEFEQGTLIGKSRQTLGGYLQDWIENIQKKEVRRTTYLKQEPLLLKVILPVL